MQLIQFVLLIGASCLLFIFLFSGAIGYFLYSLSHGTPPLEITTPTLPQWENLPKVSKEILIPAMAFLGAIWVLVGGTPVDKEDGKSESKKGRRRRYLDED